MVGITSIIIRSIDIVYTRNNRVFYFILLHCLDSQLVETPRAFHQCFTHSIHLDRLAECASLDDLDLSEFRFESNT